MALDGPVENDEIITDKGITFLVEKELLEEVKPINIEFVESEMGAGFMITSSLKKAGGGCGTTCGGSC